MKCNYFYLNLICFHLFLSIASCSFLKSQNQFPPFNKTLSPQQKELVDDKKFKTEEKKIVDIQNHLNQFLLNPDLFISSHGNADDFIAIFTNFTHINGEILLNQYLKDRHNNDIQLLIDKLNNYQTGYNDKWSFNTLSNKFILPEDIRSLSDYYKWKLVIAIMRSMDKFPVQKLGDNKMRKQFMFPEDVRIIDPPSRQIFRQ